MRLLNLDRNLDGMPNSLVKTRKQKVCKTFIRRFDPDPRLQQFPTM